MDLATYAHHWYETLNKTKDHSQTLATIPERMEIYQDFLDYNYGHVFPDLFTRLNEYCAFDWSKWVPLYIKEYPPHDFRLNELTFHFPEFLKAKKLYYQSELALYDLLEFKASFRKSYLKEKPSQSGSLLYPHTSLFLGEFQYAIASWVQLLEEQKIIHQTCPIKEEHYLVFYRPENFRVKSHKIDSLSVFILQELIDSPGIEFSNFIKKIGAELEIAETLIIQERVLALEEIKMIQVSKIPKH